MFKLGDIYVGTFPVIQPYGARPEIYSARYSVRGHQGIDFGCPSYTMVLAASRGVVFETGFDSGGYGNFVKILHDGFITLYGHLNDVAVKKDDYVIAGQLIGHSNNTGLSDTPHLHFAIAPCDTTGAKLFDDNGYSGYIDPMGTDCVWEVKNLTEPINPQTVVNPTITVAPDELSIKGLQANNFLSIAAFADQNGVSVNLTDPTAGSAINAWIASILQERLDNSVKKENTNNMEGEQTETAEVVETKKKPAFLVGLFDGLKDFIFVKKSVEVEG